MVDSILVRVVIFKEGKGLEVGGSYKFVQKLYGFL